MEIKAVLVCQYLGKVLVVEDGDKWTLPKASPVYSTLQSAAKSLLSYNIRYSFEPAELELYHTHEEKGILCVAYRVRRRHLPKILEDDKIKWVKATDITTGVFTVPKLDKLFTAKSFT